MAPLLLLSFPLQVEGVVILDVITAGFYGRPALLHVIRLTFAVAVAD